MHLIGDFITLSILIQFFYSVNSSVGCFDEQNDFQNLKDEFTSNAFSLSL